MQQTPCYRLSVIIPAYNKRTVLIETLNALEGQQSPGGFEVIVVDDGSTDGTCKVLTGLRPSYPLQVLKQTNGGPAAARNAGAAAASGELLLFLDADIVAAPGLLAAHCAGHDCYPDALVMGRVRSWPPATGGPAYRIFARSFDLGDQERILPPCFGITQNISITAADFVTCGKFDTQFPRGQDIEFAYRLDAAGIVLRYYPQALAFHSHALSLHDLCSKAREDHRRLGVLFSRHPEILCDLDYLHDKLPIAWGQDSGRMVFRKACRAALAIPPVCAGLRTMCETLEKHRPSAALLNFLVWKLIGAYQWLGLREGMKQYGWEP
jgi:glycosyltransferase involved in cell wall biosynthesis